MYSNVLESINKANLENILNSIMVEYCLIDSTVFVYDDINEESGLGENGLLLFDDNKLLVDAGKEKDNAIEQLNRTYKSYPICYQSQEIGQLNVPQCYFDVKRASKRMVDARRKLGLLINRHMTNITSMYSLGRGQELIGVSDSILEIEGFIERSSCIDYGVVINGDSGSEKLSIASAIHYNSNKRDKPFVELNCSAASGDCFRENIRNSINKSKGGTLYLSDIDCLSEDNRNTLLDNLCVSSLDSGFLLSSNPLGIRLILSRAKGTECLFSNYLISNYHFLQLSIPSLSSRREDIPYIVENLLDKYRVLSEQKFSDEAISILMKYDWPGNYKELERVVVNLIVHSADHILTESDIQKYNPEILASKNSKDNNCFSKEDIVLILKVKKYSDLDRFHAALKKSLIYISDNFDKKITLKTLSENAFVSPSHLSHLFKLHLNTSFKRILNDLRIEHAKDIFKQRPLDKITSVSFEVGFGDLSYFEKSFKGKELMTPRQFRNSVKDLNNEVFS